MERSADVEAGRRTTGLLLLAWALLGTGIAWREGEFSYFGLPMVLLSWGLVGAVAWRGVLPAPLSPVQLRAVGGFVLVSALLLRVERYMHAGERITVIQVAFVVAAASAAVLSLGPTMLRYRPPVVAYVTLGVATVIGVITVVVVDDPMIDDTVIQVACAVLGGFASLHILGPAVLNAIDMGGM